MKDYSNFVNSAYLVTFLVILVFSVVTLWQFRKNSKKLANLEKNKEGKGDENKT
jgi:heme exporter protein D